MKRRIARFSSLLITALLPLTGLVAGGCRSTSAGIEGDAAAINNPDGTVTLSKYVIVNNPSLAKGIQIVDIRTGFTDNNLMQASVAIVSKARKTLQFQYRFAWYDANGMEIDPENNAWKPVIIYGNESRSLQGMAPNSAAKEFRIKIRK